MIKGYIFDMDGTLIDSMERICRMDREILQKLGLVPTEEALEDMKYIPLGESAGYIKSHFDVSLTEAEVMGILVDTVIEIYRTVEMKAGAIDYLEFCKSQGIKMCIATATEPEIATDVARDKGFFADELKCQAYIIALGVNDVSRVLTGELEFGEITDVDLSDYAKNKPTFVGYYAKVLAK
jgi:beta-phosphoglucomutase-like phosphatase (HAD superfamily)